MLIYEVNCVSGLGEVINCSIVKVSEKKDGNLYSVSLSADPTDSPLSLPSKSQLLPSVATNLTVTQVRNLKFTFNF